MSITHRTRGMEFAKRYSFGKDNFRLHTCTASIQSYYYASPNPVLDSQSWQLNVEGLNGRRDYVRIHFLQKYLLMMYNKSAEEYRVEAALHLN